MGRYTRAMQGVITCLVLMTVLVTTFLPDWVNPVQAAPAFQAAPVASQPDAALRIPATSPEESLAEPRAVTSTAPLILSERATSRSSALLSADPTAAGSTSAAYVPSDTQTSLFLYGKVAVKVLFVESSGTGSTENWTDTEVNRLKPKSFRRSTGGLSAATAPEVPAIRAPIGASGLGRQLCFAVRWSDR